MSKQLFFLPRKSTKEKSLRSLRSLVAKFPALAVFIFSVPALAAEDLREAVRLRSDAALLQESIAVGQAEARAAGQSSYGIELRPRVTDSKAGAALRIYLPDHWSKARLREQLMLVAESEQLRVAALEWKELMAVYRDFCTYRMLHAQRDLFNEEIRALKPYLAQADQRVERRQLSVMDRAKLYSLFLDLMGDREQVSTSLLEVEQRLRFVLGPAADLDRFAASAKVEMPARMDVDALLRQALENRADYRQFAIDSRSLDVAEAAARSKDGFRFKYIQPAYNVDYEGGENSWDLSASFVLPWGTRNHDAEVLKQQQMLMLSERSQQCILIEDRLRVLLKTAEAHYDLAGARTRALKPLLAQLQQDLAQMDNGMLDQLRDRFMIRKRILDAALQNTDSICKKERLAIDLAEEIGRIW